MITESDSAPAGSALAVQVVRGRPTEEELAALIALLTEEVAAQRSVAEPSRPRRTTWQLSARNLRAPLRRDVGWGRYAG